MASTRSSQSASPAPKGTKRAADASSSPPAAKRGRGRPKKVQKTLEETMEGTPKDNDIEDDAEVAKQIDRDTASSSPGPAKRGRGRPKKAQDISKDKSGSPENNANGNDIEDDEAVAKQIQNGNGTNEDEKKSKANGNTAEKNAFDEVKADTDDVKKAANEEQEEKSKEIMNNNKSVVEDDKREASIPSSILVRLRRLSKAVFGFHAHAMILTFSNLGEGYCLLLLPRSCRS